MTLVVLAQDYAGGRYSLDWLPKPLAVEAQRPGVFDPAGLLSCRRSRTRTSFARPSCRARAGTCPGNGGTAVLRWGKGRIVLINARLLERLHVPACAASLAAVLTSGRKGKPVVVIDAGTEGGVYTPRRSSSIS